ncbi:MAG TPA: cytochrome c biogenesis protein CcsA [Longimicrobiaceae bacterium]|nr:cytochrome c biogenesis protein CcsA [Longimicrobiaceae bacterium]
MTEALHLVALALYLVAATLLGVALARNELRLTGIATAVAGVGVLAHLLGLVAFRTLRGELPLVGLGPSLSVLGLLVGLGSLAVATLGRTGPLGLVLVPVAAVLVGVSSAVGVVPSGPEMRFQGPWFVLHVTLALVGYAGLTVAFACGLMYLLQFRELKNKNFGAIFRFFPPLDTLDRMGKWALIVGFPFLTLALAVGWAWTERFGQPLAPGNPKVVWGVLSWVLILAALLARAGGGRRGVRAAAASVVAFAVVVVAYIVLRVGEPQGGGFL